jgi:hypothetical protein
MQTAQIARLLPPPRPAPQRPAQGGWWLCCHRHPGHARAARWRLRVANPRAMRRSLCTAADTPRHKRPCTDGRRGAQVGRAGRKWAVAGAGLQQRYGGRRRSGRACCKRPRPSVSPNMLHAAGRTAHSSACVGTSSRNPQHMARRCPHRGGRRSGGHTRARSACHTTCAAPRRGDPTHSTWRSHRCTGGRMARWRRNARCTPYLPGRRCRGGTGCAASAHGTAVVA